MNAPEFRHTPRPPETPANYPEARYYAHRVPGEVSAFSLHSRAGVEKAILCIYTDTWDKARSTLIGRAEISQYLTVEQLLALARACIDAAHYLQAGAGDEGGRSDTYAKMNGAHRQSHKACEAIEFVADEGAA